jgi:hypothetical protein
MKWRVDGRSQGGSAITITGACQVYSRPSRLQSICATAPASCMPFTHMSQLVHPYSVRRGVRERLRSRCQARSTYERCLGGPSGRLVMVATQSMRTHCRLHHAGAWDASCVRSLQVNASRGRSPHLSCSRRAECRAGSGQTGRAASDTTTLRP